LAKVGSGSSPHLAAGLDAYAGRGAGIGQHRDDLARAAVAEQLPELLLVVRDARVLDPGHEVGGRVAGERGATEVRILREKALGRRRQVGEVAATAARDQDLAADLAVALDHQHAPAALSGFAGAHQPRRAGADHDHVEVHRSGECAALTPAATPAKSRTGGTTPELG
jgi:hypothetical protein